MESYSNQKSANQTKTYSTLEILQIASICLDSHAHSWHSLIHSQQEGFSNGREGVPTYAEHLLVAFPSLCDPTHPKPSQLG